MELKNAIDKRFVIAGIIGLIIFVNFYFIAFPEASVDIRITNADALLKSQSFLLDRNFSFEGYENSVRFGSSGDAAIYVQKELGIEKANEIIRNDIDLWFFESRFFVPLEKKEYSVYVSPKDGAVIGFSQEILDTDDGARIAQDEAKKLALDFLASMNVDLSDFNMIYFSSEERKNRIDHEFRWEKKDYSIANATYRIVVLVYGDYVGYYDKYLYIPESFTRDYENDMSYGVVLTLASLAFMVILAILSFWVFIVSYKRNDVHMKFAIYLAAIVGTLSVAEMINAYPLVLSSYPTTISKEVFFATILVSTVISALIYMILIVMSGASGEVLSRKVLSSDTSIITNFRKKIFSADFIGASVRGYSLGFFFLGYVTMFYLVGRNFFDIWIPADAGYSSMVNTVFPFLFPLTIGVLASVSEEFMFRFFAIPLTKKASDFMFRVFAVPINNKNTISMFLALLIPAMIWAFGHSSYTVFPVYVRGIELTIAGLIFGYVFVKYDIMTVLIAHYVIDATLVGMPLLLSSNLYYFGSGVIVVALLMIPAFIAGGIILKKSH